MEDKKAFNIALQAGVPVILWGPPGTGKTKFTYSLGEFLKRRVTVVMASSKSPEDFNGLPIIDNETKSVKFAPPEWATQATEDEIIFFDEISTVAPAVQAPLLKIIHEKRVGDVYTLPEKVSICAAANEADIAAGGFDLSAPLANRFFHIHWSLDTDAWISGFISNWPKPNFPILPENWQAQIFQSRGLIASFIAKRKNLLLDMPKEDAKASKAWPSPRSWDMASTLLAAATSINESDKLLTTLMSGCVGEAPTLEFLTWRKELDLPDPEELLKNPSSIKLPKRSDIAYAVLTSVVSAVASNNTPARWEAGLKVVAIAAKDMADVASRAVHSLANIRPDKAVAPPELKNLLKVWKMSF